MSSPDPVPLYNIGVVARMTGVPVSTLRVWERRYAFPSTSRSAGIQRLYSEREVARLRWVQAHIDQGMQVSQAIRALRHQETISPPPEWTVGDQPAPDLTARPNLSALRADLLAALRSHDLARADDLLNAAVPLHPPEHLIEQVI